MRRSFTVLAGVMVLVMGVACTPPPPDGTILAIAYTNVDGVDGYDEVAGDVLIAKLVDSNDDGVVSPGDTVVTHRYPLDFDATGFGTFEVTTHEVEVAGGIPPYFITVEDDNGNTYSFIVADPIKFGYRDGYAETVSSTQEESLLLDGWSGLDVDYIDVDSASPSAPDTPVDLVRGAGGDDPFIDVDFFI